MRVGERVAVGPLLVERLSDVEWAVTTPENEQAMVSEDDHCYGWLGEWRAIDAVCRAETRADEAEWRAAQERGGLRQAHEVYPPGESIPFRGGGDA